MLVFLVNISTQSPCSAIAGCYPQCSLWMLVGSLWRRSFVFSRGQIQNFGRIPAVSLSKGSSNHVAKISSEDTRKKQVVRVGVDSNNSRVSESEGN